MNDYTHTTGTFIGKGGLEIFFQEWFVEDPVAILLIVHGVCEHSGRYANIISRLRGAGISVYALDQRGHGRSGGKRAAIDRFEDFGEDIGFFINLIRHEHHNEKIPLVMLGHSMGGLIALEYALDRPGDIDALVLSSPAVIVNVELPVWQKAVLGFLSRHLPGATLSSRKSAVFLSHDAAVVQQYLDDPLVSKRITARLAEEIMERGPRCLKRAAEIKLPLLLVHGAEDHIVSRYGTEQVYAMASSEDKEYRLFEGLYHETMNEVPHERERVLTAIHDWLIGRFGTAAKITFERRSGGKGADGPKAKKSGAAATRKKTKTKKPVRKPAPKGKK